MTQAAYRDVTIFEYLGGFEATLRCKVFCSPYWQDICCTEVATNDGRKVRIDLSCYPPGGKDQTAMGRCVVCGKWAPWDYVAGACIDCPAEAGEQAFVDYLRGVYERTGDDELIRRLVKLHWARPFIRSRPAEEDEKKDDKKPDETALLPEHLAARQNDSLPETESLTFFEHQTVAGRHWLAEALDIPEKPTRRHSIGAVALALRRHLAWVARDSRRRAVGCSVVLPLEDTDSLQEEIDNYAATGKFGRRSKRRKQLDAIKAAAGIVDDW